MSDLAAVQWSALERRSTEVAAILRRIMAQWPNLIDLTADECRILRAYREVYPPPPPLPSARGSFGAEQLQRIPAEMPDWGRTWQHVEYVLQVNERRLAAGSPAPSPPAGVTTDETEGNEPGAEEDRTGTPPPPDPSQPDPLRRTLDALVGSKTKSKLVAWLAEQPERGATFEAVAVKVYGARQATASSRAGTVRRTAERTRDELDRKGCPLRLVIEDKTIRLVDAADATRLPHDVA